MRHIDKSPEPQSLAEQIIKDVAASDNLRRLAILADNPYYDMCH